MYMYNYRVTTIVNTVFNGNLTTEQPTLLLRHSPQVNTCIMHDWASGSEPTQLLRWSPPLYISIYVIRRCHLLVPAGPRATGKRKAGSITSGYLVKTE